MENIVPNEITSRLFPTNFHLPVQSHLNVRYEIFVPSRTINLCTFECIEYGIELKSN